MRPILAPSGIPARRYLAMESSYVGASHTRRSLKGWNPPDGDAASHLLWELDTLRRRSHDVCRNSPLGSGSVNTYVTNVIGSGLKCQPRIDADQLGMDQEEADQWEAHTKREWKLFADTYEIDLGRTLNFWMIQDLSVRSMLEGGDVFLLLPSVARLGSPYKTKVQIVEAERVCNENSDPETETLAGGIRRDGNGAPVEYHILNGHPQSQLVGTKQTWQKVRAFGEKTGRRNVIHAFFPTRPNQPRGLPYLAPVLESLKQLDRYTEAELMAAVVSSMFTVFVKTEMGDELLSDMQGVAGASGSAPEPEYRLGNGAIIGLAEGEDITTANPGRPNTAFDPFFLAILRMIGACLEIPYELIIKYFQASYSAARGSMMMAWKFFMARRTFLAAMICQPIYEAFMWEAVALGRIRAPGFFSDPLLRQAYLGTEWVGPPKGQIDELKEGKAQQLYKEMGVKTLERITQEVTGESWEHNHRQSVKEHTARRDAGLLEAKEPAQEEEEQEIPEP